MRVHAKPISLQKRLLDAFLGVEAYIGGHMQG